MLKIVCSIILLSLGCLQTVNASENEKAEVMLFGVSHFANPGFDKVKTDQINAMTKEN